MNEDKHKFEILYEREKIACKIFAELNNFTESKNTLKIIIRGIKDLVNCQVANIYLYNNGSYSCYDCYGIHSNSCIVDEKILSSICNKRELLLLGCMCQNIFNRRFNPKLSYFTPKGSFWTSDLSELLKTITSGIILTDTKITCSLYGNESVAIIPIKYRGNVIGLLRLIDKRKDIFSLDLIEYVESIGEHIGLAVYNSAIIDELQMKLEQGQNHIKDRDELDTLKVEFFTNIAHELKTPVNVILSAVQLLNFRTGNVDLNSLRRYVSIIKQNSYRILRLVNNIMDTSKLDSNCFDLNLQNCDIVKVVEDITLSVVEYAEIKGLEIIFDTDMEEKVIACDPDCVERVMLNIISNAIKFTNEGGTILVSIQETDKDIITIRVKDTGIGIPWDKLEVIFERFKQIDKAESPRATSGSGIGLSLAKQIIDRSGGRIWAESKPGNGSEFIIELPCQILEIPYCDYNKGNIELDQNNSEKLSIELSDIYI